MMRWLPFACLFLWISLALFTVFFPVEGKLDLAVILAPPQASAWFGYDELGRDILPRLLAGARTSLWVASMVVACSFLIGTVIGIIGAWYGSWVDRGVVLLIDLFMAFPGLLLAISFAALLGPGINNAVFALALVGWVGFARLARAQTLSLKKRDHIAAVRALGGNSRRILALHIFPLILAPLLVEASFAVSATVIAETSLSFLGLGVQPPVASWGNMIREGTRYMLVAPHLVLAPGIAIFAVVLSVNLVGESLRDVLDRKGH
ncbi:MAG: ABC transporter permease [Candidatus Eutrophobiaceae bacterium]